MKLDITVCWHCYRKDRSACKETPEEAGECSRFIYNPSVVWTGFSQGGDNG